MSSIVAVEPFTTAPGIPDFSKVGSRRYHPAGSVFIHPTISVVRATREQRSEMPPAWGEKFQKLFSGTCWNLDFSNPGTRDDPETAVGFLQTLHDEDYPFYIARPKSNLNLDLGICVHGTMHRSTAEFLSLYDLFGDNRDSVSNAQVVSSDLHLDLSGIEKGLWSYLAFIGVLPEFRGRGEKRGVTLPEDHLTISEYFLYHWLWQANIDGCEVALIRTHKKQMALITPLLKWGFRIIANYRVMQYNQPTTRVLLAKERNGCSLLSGVMLT